MNKEQLKKFIDLYNEAEIEADEVKKLFCMCDSLYVKYNYIIHKLLEYQLGYENTDLLEHYIWKQIDISFEEFCEKLNIKDETNKK